VSGLTDLQIEMKFRFSIIIGYITMFLWLWMLNALYETELNVIVTRAIPMIGLMLTMLLVYGLERLAKETKKDESARNQKVRPIEPSTAHRPNES